MVLVPEIGKHKQKHWALRSLTWQIWRNTKTITTKSHTSYQELSSPNFLCSGTFQLRCSLSSSFQSRTLLSHLRWSHPCYCLLLIDLVCPLSVLPLLGSPLLDSPLLGSCSSSCSPWGWKACPATNCSNGHHLRTIRAMCNVQQSKLGFNCTLLSDQHCLSAVHHKLCVKEEESWDISDILSGTVVGTSTLPQAVPSLLFEATLLST